MTFNCPHCGGAIIGSVTVKKRPVLKPRYEGMRPVL
jgi:hypothetical protein